MSNCIPCAATKHAVLINNCYPPLKEGGTTPRSSELSYLTFYASSKPVKLTKVGSYLQNKVEKDIRKGRKSHNLVSLNIIKALIQTCNRDLNIFSKYVIRILNMLLDTRDLEIIDLTCETFIVFCSYHEGSNLGVDMDFTSKYESLLKKFTGFCNYSNEDTVFCLKMQYIGHRAVQAAISSTALQASNCKSQVDILFPPLIATLVSSKNATYALQSSDGRTIDIRGSVIDTHDINPNVVDLVASHSIDLLFNRVAGPLIRSAIAPLYKYLDEKERWSPAEFPVNIMKLVLQSVQPQYKYLLVSDVMLQLGKVENSDNTMMSDKHATLVSIINALFNANIPLAGISVLEILNSLFTHLMKTTQHHPYITTVPEEKSAIYTIQQGLVHSMGGLAMHLYYENQFNDMVGYFVSKLRPNTFLEYVDDMLLYDYRVIVMCCLNSLVLGFNKAIPPNSSEAEINYAGRKVSLDAWQPSLGLLHDVNAKTRIQFSKCLYGLLSTVPTTLSQEPADDHPKHVMKNASDFAFMYQLTQAFYQCILLDDFNLTDLKLLYAFLCILNRKFGVDATSVLVPLVFKVQQLLEEEKVKLYTRRYCIESALIDWFTMTAQFYHIDPLLEYIKSLKEQRGRFPDDPLFTEAVDERFLTEVGPEVFPVHVEDRNEKVNGVWIDRGTVVELMSNHGQLRDESDPRGLDLESRLFAEWGSEAYMKNDFSNNEIINHRNKVIQESKQLKPKLASPWESHEIQRKPLTLEDRKESMRVDKLKEALNRPMATDDDGDTTSSQSNHSLPQINPVPIASKGVAALLDELNVSQHEASTVSLINPPY